LNGDTRDKEAILGFRRHHVRYLVFELDHFTLPSCTGEELHFLSARVDYTEGVVSHAEVSFGGPWAGETSTELTAVPLLRSKRGKRLDPGALERCLLVGGREATVVAVEQAPANLVIVCDRTAEVTLRSIHERRLSVGTYTDAPSGLSPDGKIRHTLEEMRDLRPSCGSKEPTSRTRSSSARG
jgi:hypothetical protein